MQDIKQQLREEFVSKLFGDFNLPSGYPSKEKIADWWLSKLSLAVEQEKERIINGIDKMERDCLCSPLQREICDIERTFRRTQHRIITLINNK